MTRSNEKVEEKNAELLKLTMEFSKKFLNDEYEEVIKKLINKMARKREVPFLSGRIEIWAAAVIHALGTINFLFDKSTQPYVSAKDIFEYFGTKQSTTSQKSKKIRDMFNMTYFDSNFSIKSVDQDSPFNNLTMVNGLIVPQDFLNDKHVEMEEWEFQAAQILGIQGLEKGKKYKESYLFELLQVQETSLMDFYEHLVRHITFPFTAVYEEGVGPLEIAEFEVNCRRLDQEMKVDETYGILVECRLGREEVILPLASINLDEGQNNFIWIDLYKDWFWSYR
nr:DUF6398 domain-containing protein [Paenibacillus bovis]